LVFCLSPFLLSFFAACHLRLPSPFTKKKPSLPRLCSPTCPLSHAASVFLQRTTSHSLTHRSSPSLPAGSCPSPACPRSGSTDASLLLCLHPHPGSASAAAEVPAQKRDLAAPAAWTVHSAASASPWDSARSAWSSAAALASPSARSWRGVCPCHAGGGRDFLPAAEGEGGPAGVHRAR